MRNRYTPIAAAISLAMATFAGPAGADSLYWSCANDYWDHANCWSPKVIPTSNDYVNVDGSTPGLVLGIDNFTQAVLGGPAAAYMLTIDSVMPGRTASLIQTGGALKTTYQFIGLYGTGSVSQSAGVNTTDLLYLGTYGNGVGTYNLSGGSLTAGSEFLGDSNNSSGKFTQSGGSHSVTSLMVLGYWAGSSANFELSAGTLTNSALTVGREGNGLFLQSGGSHDVTSLALGTNLGGSGSYILNGGTLNVSGAITTGAGSGWLTLDGGSLTVGSGNIAVSNFIVGFSKIGDVSYTQTSGDVSASVLTLGVSHRTRGYYQLNGGSLTTTSELIGSSGTGSFSQLAGSHTVTGDIVLGLNHSPNYTFGTYTLSGGTLYVGGAIKTGASEGNLNLDGGVLTVGSGNIGVTSLNLGSVAGSSFSYVQSKGAVAVGGNLSLGVVADSAGAYTLSGGSLNVGGSIAGGAGVSTLNLDGGDFLVGNGTLAVTHLALGTQAGSSFTLHIDPVQSSNSFASLVTSTMTVGGLGAGQVIQTGGSNTVGTLTINDSYTYSGGSLVVSSSLINNGAFLLYGTTLNNAGTTENNGTLSGYGRINSSGAFTNNAAVSQSGGHLTLAGAGPFTNNGNWDLQSGYQLKLEGSSFENAGVLSLNNGQVTGTGTLTNTIGGTVAGRGVIATNFANAGTLALTDGATTVTKGFVNSGVIQLGGNTALLNGGALTNTGLVQGYGKVASAVTNSGSIQASGGTLTLTQALSNGGTLVADKASTLLFLGGLTANSGNIRINGGALDNTGHTLGNSGKIQVSTGAGQLYGGVTGLAGSQLIVSGGGSLTLYDTVDIKSGAELRVAAGASATFFGQVYQRTGSVFSGTGTKNYEGGFSVGASPGLGVDAGSVNFGAGDSFLVEIGGTSACTAACATNVALTNSSFDKYIVGGSLALGGTLKLVSWNGYVAQAGQHFDLLDWGSVSGSFSRIDAGDLLLAAGTQLDTSRLYTDGVIGVTAVPEPATVATMLAGLSAMALLRRRRAARPAIRA